MSKQEDQPNYPPRGMRRVQAASYVGIGTTKFDEMVKDGRMPKPKLINACKVWDRYELEACFDNLSDLGVVEEADPFEGISV